MLQTKKPRLFYFLLVLGCMNFLGRGSIVLLLLCLYELFRRKSYIAIDRNAIIIACFSLCVIFAAATYYSYSECIKAVNYFLMYVLGYDSYRRAEDKAACVEYTALAICIGFGLELVLMYLYNYNREQLSVRSMYSIWTGETIAVTLLGLLVSAVIGFSFYSFFYTKKKGQKVVVFFLLAVGLIISVNTATRTPFVMLFVVYAVMLVIHLFNKRGIKALRFVALGIILLLLVVLLFGLDVGGIRSATMNTHLVQRFLNEELEDGRLSRMKLHMEMMLDYPWGGGHIEAITGKNGHNYLQQGHDLYGIFAFIFLLAITVQFVSNLVRLLKKRGKTGIDMLFLSMYLSMWIQICLEPIFTGYPILFWSLLVVHGMATAYLRQGYSSNDVRGKYRI